MKLPRWDCRNAADQKRLEEWTIERLNELDEPTAEDLQREIEMNDDEKYIYETRRLISERLTRGAVIVAAKNKDREALTRLLAKSPHLQPLAMRVLLTKKGKGQKRASRAPVT